MKSYLSILLLQVTLAVIAISSVCAFVPVKSRSLPTSRYAVSDPTSATEETAEDTLYNRDRYVATNRFAVRRNKAAKFEQRWATRKSRLAELPGFKYFHLMRRVTLETNEETGVSTVQYDEGTDEESSQGNMVSFTVWDTKKDFNAWRRGDAFIEAHGGKSIGAFVSTMVNSALVLRGAPRPAFYDGLFFQSMVPENQPEIVNGWRNVEADGKNTLPTECFVACNQFFVPRENAKAFEERWANRESVLKECPGFVAFGMMRRDGQAKGHGTVPLDVETEPTYVSTTIWKDVASFEAWRSGSAFSKAHKPAKSDNSKETTETKAAPPAPLWSRPPKPVFYEGVLVISSEEGA